VQRDALQERMKKFENDQLVSHGQEMGELISLRADLEAKNSILSQLHADLNESQQRSDQLESQKKLLESQTSKLQQQYEGETSISYDSSSWSDPNSFRRSIQSPRKQRRQIPIVTKVNG
jgi:hypothetical protein